MRRMRNGEHLPDLLDEYNAGRRAAVRAIVEDLGPPELVARYDRDMRDIDLGITNARSEWHSISPAQRRALLTAAEHGRLDRVGKEYRHPKRYQPYRPIHVATIRNLCARDLLAWDGGAFDPEAAVVVTERGRFVVQHGDTKKAPGP